MAYAGDRGGVREHWSVGGEGGAVAGDAAGAVLADRVAAEVAERSARQQLQPAMGDLPPAWTHLHEPQWLLPPQRR